MIHLNSKLNETLYGKIKNNFLPEMYEALSIYDFQSGVDNIKPTQKLFPPAIFYYGSSIITFHDTNINLKRGKPSSLYDQTGTLDILVHKTFPGSQPYSLSKIDNLDLKMHIFSATLLYNKNYEKPYLIELKLHGPPLNTEKTLDLSLSI